MKTENKTDFHIKSLITLTVLLVATAALFLGTAAVRGSLDIKQILLACTVVVLALAAVGMAFARRAVKTKKRGMLSPDFRRAIEDIMITVDAANMSKTAKTGIEQDLVDWFAEASANGKTPDSVIGESKEAFAAEIIQAHGARNNFWVYILSGVQYFVLYMLIVQFFEFIKDTSIGFFATPVDISALIIFGLIALVGIPLMLYFKDIGMKKGNSVLLFGRLILSPVLLLAVSIGFIEALHAGWFSGAWVGTILYGAVRIFANTFVLAAAVAIILLCWLAKRMIQKQKLRSILD